MYETLLLSREGSFAVLTLNRPDRRNALSPTLMAELLDALGRLEAEPAIRTVIITGAGTAFCAGMDLETLRQIATHTLEENLEDSRRMATLFRRLYTFPKPLIAAVNGPAIAGGCGLATLCDFTLAVPEARFGYTEVRIGFVPALVSVFLRRMVGEKHARELLLSARLLDAEEAFRLGLVTEVVPTEALLARARELAAMLAANSPTSLLRTKTLLNDCTLPELDRELALAIEANAAIRLTENFREGLAAFLEKRTPRWVLQ
jgi:methylglutaconyl-CoA hydratase